jgi:hypothetical protein
MTNVSNYATLCITNCELTQNRKSIPEDTSNVLGGKREQNMTLEQIFG